MVRIVQKYGGTSVKDLQCIRAVAEKIKQRHDAGDDLVVVVSARSGVTNRLIADAKQLSRYPNARELDALLCIGEQETVALLAIALNEINVKASSRLAFQVGLRTCNSHGNARIIDIDGAEIDKLLAEKTVVIVAGFQGITNDGHLTTLGRGGSDLTALALAYKLKADKCEIYTDVDGVHTGDPKIIKNSKVIREIDFESLLRLSFFDNKVMQDRSIAFAQKQNVKFSIAHAFKNSVGTQVVATYDKYNGYESCIIGITGKTNISLISCEVCKDIVVEMLKFFKGHGIATGFIKHRQLEQNKFYDEIGLDTSDFGYLHGEFLASFQNHIVAFRAINDLARIDIIGTNIQDNEKALSVFHLLADKNIVRSEYGKHGLSFLVPSRYYEELSNDIHDAVMS